MDPRNLYFNFHLFFKYETIETHTRTFLPLDILAVGSVNIGRHIHLHICIHIYYIPPTYYVLYLKNIIMTYAFDMCFDTWKYTTYMYVFVHSVLCTTYMGI